MSFRSAKTALKNPIVELSLELTDPDSSPKPDEQKAKTYQRYFSVTIDILDVDVCHSPTVNMSS